MQRCDLSFVDHIIDVWQPIYYVRGLGQTVKALPTDIIELRRLFEAQTDAYQTLYSLMLSEKQTTDKLVRDALCIHFAF